MQQALFPEVGSHLPSPDPTKCDIVTVSRIHEPLRQVQEAFSIARFEAPVFMANDSRGR